MNNAIKQFWKNIDDQKEENPNYVSPKEGEYFIAWKIMLSNINPTTRLILMIDAKTGQILNVIDLLKYSTGKVRIFDPNPTISSGDITLSKMTSESTLSKYLREEDINNINDPVNGIFILAGKYVKMKELESPSFTEPKSPNGEFIYNLNDRKFLCANAYYHIDKFLNYLVNDVQLTEFSDFSIPIDPQGVDGEDNSHYDPVDKYIAFGEDGVPDASDGQVVVHELCHALFDHINPGFDNARAGNNEGNADTGAAIYFDDKHFNPNRTRGLMMPWDASPFGTPQASWPGRRYDMNWRFDQPEYTNVTDPHKTGQLICSTVFELYRKMGGDSENSLVKQAARDLSLRLLFMAISRLPRRNSISIHLEQEIEAADSNLNGWRYPDGLHRKVIYDTFLRRHTGGYIPKETDIYIEDGRHGGYGSLSSEDEFSEKLWKEDYWNKGEIWTKPEPYSDNSLQQKGSPVDHKKPIIGVSINLYVKVKNKGNKTSGSGPANILAYRTKKGKESVFPDDYVQIGSLTIPNIIPGIERGVVVGPFKYVPEGENDAVLIIAECDEDQSITKNRNSSISCLNLVPFDNNIGMRIL